MPTLPHTHPRIIFSTEEYDYLKQEILEIASYENGSIERHRFPDGELYQRVVNNVRGKHVSLIGGATSDGNTLELYDLACALVDFGARSLNLVIPYYAYSTMERSVTHGEVVTAKTRARLFSAIPKASYQNRVILLDLHSEGLPYYFEMGLPAVHLYAKVVIAEAAEKMAGAKNFVLASTDAGRAKWVESLANDLGVEAAFVFKQRISGSEVQISGINANVKGRKVVIYDDMIRTGSTIIQAAKAYLEAGASEIYVLTTHGIFAGDGFDKIMNSGLVRKMAATNSHPSALKFKHDDYQVLSIAPVFARTLSTF